MACDPRSAVTAQRLPIRNRSRIIRPLVQSSDRSRCASRPARWPETVLRPSTIADLAIPNLRQGGRQYGRRRKMARYTKPKSVVRFPDLEHSKIAVLNSLPAASSQESYGHAIDEFIGWTARSHAWHSTEPLFSATGSFLNRRASRLRRSTCDSRQCAGSLTKLLIPDC